MESNHLPNTMRSSSSQPLEVKLMLNSLPNDIIAAILSSVPTELAMDSSLLSEDSKDLWTLVSVVDLDEVPTRSWFKQEPYSDYTTDPVAHRTRQCRLHHLRKEKIITIMERYMKLHEDCIMSFKLKFTTEGMFDPLVDQWLQFVIEKKVKELDLDLRAHAWDGPAHRYRLPVDIFPSTSSLQVLTLRGCSIDDYSFSLQALRSLKKVILDDVDDLTVHTVKVLLLHSEFLTLKKLVVKGGIISSQGQTPIANEKMKGLKIVECSQAWIEGCEIYVPNLEKFKYKGEKVNFTLRSAPPNLEKATIIVNKDLGVNNAFRRLINQVCFVKYLTLGFANNFTGIHQAEGEEQENEIPLEPFIYLREFLVITGGVDAHERTAGCLIKNAPRLRKYDICPEFMVSKGKIELWGERIQLSEFM